MSMEMSSFIITDLRPFVPRQDLIPGVRLKFYRYGLLDLASLNGFRFFLVVSARGFIPTHPRKWWFALTAPGDIDKAVRFLFPRIQHCMITLMVVCVYIALALWLKLKVWDNLYWYLQVYGLIYVPLFFGSLCHERRRVRRSRRLAHFLLGFIL
jgi:hypothetical protein